MAVEEKKTVERTTCWIEKELIRMAKAIAGIEGQDQSASEVLEEELTGPLTKRYRKAISRGYAELGEAGA